MNEEKSMAPVQAAPIAIRRGELEPQNLSELVTLARILARSGMVPKHYQGRVDDVIVALQMGAEVGLSPMASLQNIAVINGRPSIWGDALIGIALAHPECEDVIETFDEKTMTASCTVKRAGHSPVTETFSQADAVTAGLWKKQGPWTQYPKRMLKMRARGFAVRDSFADALRGISPAEESADLQQPVPVTVFVRSDFEELPENASPPPEEAAAEEQAPEPVVEPAAEVAAEVAEPAGDPLPASESRILAKELQRVAGPEAFAAFCDVHGLPPAWTKKTHPIIMEAIRKAKEAKS